jgi:hypothetical protein
MEDGVTIQPFFTSALSGHKYLIHAAAALLPGLKSVIKVQWALCDLQTRLDKYK